MKWIVATLGLLVAGSALAQSTVNQGSGSTTGTKPWRANIAADVGGKTTEVTVTNGAGGTAVPATPLANRRAIEIQNNGPNPIYCTVDGSAPVATTNGRWILAAAAWSLDAGPAVVVKCIAGTAAQVSGAATMVTELK
jgi:hypothetical protein